MSEGYTPLFGTLTKGSLCGRWPDIGLWAVVLSMANKNGVVDAHPTFIAGVTGLALPDVIACMKRFCEPDPHSRSGENGGARLVLLEPPREWGWRIVNHGAYREKARLAAKSAREVEAGKNKQRMGSRSPPPTAGDRRGPPSTDPSNANADSNKSSKKAANAADRREEAKELWPRVLAAIRCDDLQKAFPPDSDVGRIVSKLGGWKQLGAKNRDLRGQTEQRFLNAYAEAA